MLLIMDELKVTESAKLRDKLEVALMKPVHLITWLQHRNGSLPESITIANFSMALP